MAEKDTTYIDYETFLSPTFSPTTFSNTLILSTNNASDTSLDLSTPLSKTLFDLQEVDTHIHTLTSASALPLLSHSQSQLSSSAHILTTLQSSLTALAASYARLESEVVTRHAAAEQVRLAAARLWVTIKIGRGALRALQLGRRLETQMVEMRPALAPSAGAATRDEARAMTGAAGTLVALRALFAADGAGEEGEHLGRIAAVGTLRRELIEPSEARVRGRAQQVIREFSLSNVPTQTTTTTAASGQNPSGRQDSRSPSPSKSAAMGTSSTYAQTAEMRQRATAALVTLYLLSPVPAAGSRKAFSPTLLLTALQTYLHTSLTSSAASLSRALAQLPTLPRALQEVTARCKNVVALEVLLQSTSVPDHPLLVSDKENRKLDGTNGTAEAKLGEGESDESTKENLLTPLLNALDTSSLPSFFWRSLASGMSSKVGDILNREGAPARTLRTNRDNIRERLRDAVLRGCEGARLPDGRVGDNAWEREAAVMVASVVGPLGR